MADQRNKWDDFWINSGLPVPKISWSKKRILAILEPYAQRGLRALDAGCGSGFFSAYFCEKGMETTSVDYSEKSIKLTDTITCKRAKTLQLDMVSAAFAQNFENKFDLIFNDGLFEHFSKAEQNIIVGNLKAVLSPTGYLISFVPNLFSLWTLIRPFLMPGIEEKPFTIKELRDLNIRNGLSIQTFGGINTLPWRISFEGPVAACTGMLLFSISKLRTRKY